MNLCWAGPVRAVSCVNSCFAKLAIVLAAFLLTACATPIRSANSHEIGAQWTGRMSVRVGGATPQSFTADFELQGGAPSGQLLLLSPLGTTLARLSWNPSHALLERPGQTNASFFSLAEMAQAATGVDIPVHQLFDWLAGRPTPATDWEVDLGALDAGRLNARRTDPNLQAELRLVLSR